MTNTPSPEAATDDPDAAFLTVPELAALLRIDRTTAYDWVRRGVVPSIRLGGKALRIPRRALEAWIEDQARASQGSA